MDLSNAFDCIPHDLLIVKLSAYGYNANGLKYIYTYLKNRKQCVRVNNVCSDFKDIISGDPQGSIVGPMLFNAFLNDFFFCIRKASVHNFADDNTLSSFAKSVTLLVEILTTESQNAIKWFSENKMIVNPDKFKSIVIHKSSQTSKPKQFLIGNDVVEVASSVKLLGIHIDDQLSFNLHISNICKSASKQLNALVRLKSFLGFEERKVLINSFILSNFNYCPLVWSISSAKSLNKVENLHKRALRFLHND